ncbi:MAG TPA: cyclic nucleotide-binding domain-containing protein [Terrimicrobiaceae bacterium]
MWPVAASLFFQMVQLFEILKEHPKQHFGAGETIIAQGSTTGMLYFLIDGEVEVDKDEVPIATTTEPGSVFGEMSALLGTSHRARVRAVAPSSFYVVEDGRKFMEVHPVVSMHVSEVLARRLDALNRYLVDVRQQFEGHDHLSMVDEVLEVLMYRQRRPPVR